MKMAFSCKSFPPSDLPAMAARIFEHVFESYLERDAIP